MPGEEIEPISQCRIIRSIVGDIRFNTLIFQPAQSKKQRTINHSVQRSYLPNNIRIICQIIVIRIADSSSSFYSNNRVYLPCARQGYAQGGRGSRESSTASFFCLLID